MERGCVMRMQENKQMNNHYPWGEYLVECLIFEWPILNFCEAGFFERMANDYPEIGV
jgi:hypothetical protein